MVGSSETVRGTSAPGSVGESGSHAISSAPPMSAAMVCLREQDMVFPMTAHGRVPTRALPAPAASDRIGRNGRRSSVDDAMRTRQAHARMVHTLPPVALGAAAVRPSRCITGSRPPCPTPTDVEQSRAQQVARPTVCTQRDRCTPPIAERLRELPAHTATRQLAEVRAAGYAGGYSR